MSRSVFHPRCFTPPLWRLYANLALTLLLRAFGLSLLIALLPTLPLLAKAGSSDKCPIPAIPSNFGYQVTRATDQLGQQWVYLYYHLQIGNQDLSRKLDQFSGEDMVRAIKEAESWRRCVEKKVKNAKAVPAPGLPPLPAAAY